MTYKSYLTGSLESDLFGHDLADFAWDWLRGSLLWLMEAQLLSYKSLLSDFITS